MRQYNYLQAIFMSFYSRRLYRDVGENWGAGVFLYLLLLLAICGGITIYYIQHKMNYLLATNNGDVYVQQMPQAIHIKNGMIETSENRPYIIKDPETKETLVVIDTTGQYTTLEKAQADILVTRDSILYNDTPKDRVTIQRIPEKLVMDITPSVVQDKILRFGNWIWVLLFPFVLIFSFLYRIVQSLFYAIIGKIFAVLLNVPLPYVRVFKLAMVAVTPAIVLGTALEWLRVGINHQTALFFALSMLYLIFAVRANKNI